MTTDTVIQVLQSATEYSDVSPQLLLLLFFLQLFRPTVKFAITGDGVQLTLSINPEDNRRER